MSWQRRLTQAIRNLFRKRSLDTELDAELRFHLEKQIEENLRRGMSKDEARRQALIELGGVEQVKEQVREARSGFLLETLWKDLRYGARMLGKNPAFTIVAILTLALGIGANAAIFSLVDGIVLRPLPYPDPTRLFLIFETSPESGPQDISNSSNAPANYLDWQAQSASFEHMAAWTGQALNLSGVERPERLRGMRVSWSLFPMLGVEPALGRWFLPEEDRTGAPRAVILGNGIWERRFGADRGILGRVILLNEQPYTVVGVMPRAFAFPTPEVDVWVPIAFSQNEQTSRGAHFIQVGGRLKPGASITQAQAEMDTLTHRLAEAYPQTNTNIGARVVPLQQAVVGQMGETLKLLWGMVGLVLLVACVNVANLLLARAHGREREVAVRLALGASTGRLLRQFLTESLLLGLCGGLAGVLLAAWGAGTLLAAIGVEVPRFAGLRIDGSVLAFTLALSLVTGFLFGWIPALRLARPAFAPALKEGGRTGATRRRNRALNALAVGELAMTLVLVSAAGLLIHSFVRLRAVDPGFDARNVLTMNLSLAAARYAPMEQRVAFDRQLLERIQALPGVETAALVSFLPMDFPGGIVGFLPEGQPVPPASEWPRATYRVVTPDYFRVLKIPLRRGRLFTEQEVQSNPMVALVEEETVARYWQGQDPVGARFRFGNSSPWIEVVGVVGGTRQFGLNREPAPGIYIPYAQSHMRWATPSGLVVRVRNRPQDLTAAVQNHVWALDPEIPISNVGLLESLVSRSIAAQRADSLVAGSFGALTLLLAMVGVYGVVAFQVSQRTHEFGVRMALGARREDILRLVLRDAFWLLIWGLGLGLVGTQFATRHLASRLFAMGPNDLRTFLVVTLVLAGATLAASLIPARRAMRVDPIVALRYE